MNTGRRHRRAGGASVPDVPGIRRQMAEYDSVICQAKPGKNRRMVPDTYRDGLACLETGEL